MSLEALEAIFAPVRASPNTQFLEDYARIKKEYPDLVIARGKAGNVNRTRRIATENVPAPFRREIGCVDVEHLRFFPVTRAMSSASMPAVTSTTLKSAAEWNMPAASSATRGKLPPRRLSVISGNAPSVSPSPQEMKTKGIRSSRTEWICFICRLYVIYPFSISRITGSTSS